MASISNYWCICRRLTFSLAIAVYEYLITFDREFEGFWKGPYNIATVLWFLVSCRLFSECLSLLILAFLVKNRYTVHASFLAQIYGESEEASCTIYRHDALHFFQ